jgi:hypothetical protein
LIRYEKASIWNEKEAERVRINLNMKFYQAAGLYSAILYDIFDALLEFDGVDIHTFNTPSGDGVDTLPLLELLSDEIVLTPQKSLRFRREDL